MRIVLEITLSKFGPDVDIQPDDEALALSQHDHEQVVDEVIRSMTHYRILNADQTDA